MLFAVCYMRVVGGFMLTVAHVCVHQNMAATVFVKHVDHIQRMAVDLANSSFSTDPILVERFTTLSDEYRANVMELFHPLIRVEEKEKAERVTAAKELLASITSRAAFAPNCTGARVAFISNDERTKLKNAATSCIDNALPNVAFIQSSDPFGLQCLVKNPKVNVLVVCDTGTGGGLEDGCLEIPLRLLAIDGTVHVSVRYEPTQTVSGWRGCILYTK